MKKWVGRLIGVGAIITLLVFVGGGVFYFLNKEAIREFRPSLSAFYAKSFCSCYFVSQRSASECHDYSKQYIPIDEVYLDEKLRRVRVRALGETSISQFVNSREGCWLEPI
jgi:hypothetical protein